MPLKAKVAQMRGATSWLGSVVGEVLGLSKDGLGQRNCRNDGVY
jgi:hypothetical protein